MIQPYLASWRGVPFDTVSTSNSGGRKTSTHDFAQLDGQWVEDRATMARTFKLSAFVQSRTARLALLDACEKPGPGVLVHPTMGRMVVQLLTWQLDDSVVDGDVTRFELQFAETKAPPLALPSRVTSVAGTIASVATTASNTTVAVYTSARSTVADLQVAGADIAGAIEDALRVVTLPLATTAAVLGAVSRQATRAITAAGRIATYPAQAVAEVQSLVQLISDGPAIRAMRRWADALPEPGASDNTQAAVLQRATNNLWRQTVVAQLGQVIIDSSYTSQQDAEAAKVDWVDACESALEYGSSIAELQAVLGSVAGWLDGLALKLPKLIKLELDAPLPALVLAWQLYGNYSREGDLVARNQASSGLLSGTVQVLTA